MCAKCQKPSDFPMQDETKSRCILCADNMFPTFAHSSASKRRWPKHQKHGRQNGPRPRRPTGQAGALGRVQERRVTRSIAEWTRGEDDGSADPTECQWSCQWRQTGKCTCKCQFVSHISRAQFHRAASREFCLANIFAKHFKTDYQPKYINFTCKFGW